MTDKDFVIKDGVLVRYSGVDESVVIPKSVHTIEEYAFYNRGNLHRVDIPSHVNNINRCAFFSCVHLESIFIAEGVKNVSEFAVGFCENLREITILSETLELEFKKIDSTNMENLKSITIPYKYWKVFNKVKCSYKKISITTAKSISKRAFKDISTLEEITIPDSVKTIPESCFENCTNLRTFTVSPNVKTIRDFAFRGCKNLEIQVPKTVTSIGVDAFKDCKKVIYLA